MSKRQEGTKHGIQIKLKHISTAQLPTRVNGNIKTNLTGAKSHITCSTTQNQNFNTWRKTEEHQGNQNVHKQPKHISTITTSMAINGNTKTNLIGAKNKSPVPQHKIKNLKGK
jgi:hypothetical protein